MRSGLIDLVRLGFALELAVFHTLGWALMPGAHYALEIFTLSAGLFLFERLGRDGALCPGGRAQADRVGYVWRYLKRRARRLLPWTSLAFVWAFVLLRGPDLVWLTPARAVKWAAESLWELSLLFMAAKPVGQVPLNLPVWSVSAMLLCEVFLVALAVYGGRWFGRLLPALLAAALAGMALTGEADPTFQWLGLACYGAVRVFAGYGLAWYGWLALQKLRALRPGGTMRTALTLAELAAWACVPALMYTTGSRAGQFAAAVCGAAGMVLDLSGHSLTAGWVRDCPLTRWLGELSLAVFLVNYPLNVLYSGILPLPDAEGPGLALWLAAVNALAGTVFLLVFKGLNRCLGGLRLRPAGKPAAGKPGGERSGAHHRKGTPRRRR